MHPSFQLFMTCKARSVFGKGPLRRSSGSQPPSTSPRQKPQEPRAFGEGRVASERLA